MAWRGSIPRRRFCPAVVRGAFLASKGETMNIRKVYQSLRQAGYNASHAHSAAKTIAEYAALEQAGLVRLRAEPEQENYFDVYGEPEGYTDINGRWHTPEQERQEIADSIDRNGLWFIVAEWRDNEESEWQHADSIGMNAGYSDPLDPRENVYVPDLMRSAVNAAQSANYSI